MKVTIIVEHAGYSNRISLVSEGLNLDTLDGAHRQARDSLSRQIETLFPHPTLIDVGDRKIQVIKLIREYTGLGLKEAKEASENLPKRIPPILPEKLGELVTKLRELGATVHG